MAKTKDKTNVMRVLEQYKVAYTPHTYPHEEGVPVDGITSAARMGKDPATVFKTLVTKGASGLCHVFVIPVHRELDLKAAARACGEKSVAMLPLTDLLPLTGYVRGGCSPIGMKKHFPTYIHHTCNDHPYIYISAGVRGLQVKIAPADLLRIAQADVAELF